MPEITVSDGVLICSGHGQLVKCLGKWTGRTMYECPECGTYVVEDVAEVLLAEAQ